MKTVSFSKKIILGFFLLQMQFDTVALSFKSIKIFLKKHKTLITLCVGFGLGVYVTHCHNQSVLIKNRERINFLETRLTNKVGRMFHVEPLAKALNEAEQKIKELEFGQSNLLKKYHKTLSLISELPNRGCTLYNEEFPQRSLGQQVKIIAKMADRQFK